MCNDVEGWKLLASPRCSGWTLQRKNSWINPWNFFSKMIGLWRTKWPVTTATECFSTISKISSSQMYSVLQTHQSTYGRTTLHLRVVNDFLISRLALTTNVMFFYYCFNVQLQLYLLWFFDSIFDRSGVQQVKSLLYQKLSLKLLPLFITL